MLVSTFSGSNDLFPLDRSPMVMMCVQVCLPFTCGHLEGWDPPPCPLLGAPCPAQGHMQRNQPESEE